MSDNIDQILELVSENSDLKGSFFEELLLTMQSGNFTDESKELDPATEEVVGEMNCLEKALQTLYEKYAKNDTSIRIQLLDMWFYGSDSKGDEMKQLLTELEGNTQRFNAVKGSFSSSIVDRFMHLAKPGSMGFAIRSQYQVANIMVRNNLHNDMCDLAAALANSAFSSAYQVKH